MSEDQPRIKRTKCINTWFTSKSTQASSSQAPVCPPCPPSESPIIHSENPSQEFDRQCNINAPERDPGKRTQIWKYPVNERDRIRRSYILLGPNQPNWRHKQFPLTEEGGQNRRFNPAWFNRYPWLEYSIHLDRAFCFPCFLFDIEHSQNQTFTVDGYNQWKKACSIDNNVFMHHVGSLNSLHNSAMQKWDSLRNPTKQIDHVMAPKMTPKDVEGHLLRLVSSIESVRLLANQGMAFRGHDESEKSENAGNFIQVIKSYGRVSEAVASVTLKKSPRNAKYTSPDIQKEILEILAEKVRHRIIQEMGDAKFCILVDEAVDTAHKEQMSIILRFVDFQGMIKERFFKIVSVPNTTSLTLKTEICKVLAKFNLDVKNIRGQGYDGANNMSGIWHGLQALFLEECPYAYYVHCFAHRLQLALCASAKGVPEIWEFFNTLNLIVNFVDSSAKRHCELKAAREEEIVNLVACGDLSTGKGANQTRSLQRACATRWSSHWSSITSLISLFGPTLSTLNHMKTDGPRETRGPAQSVLKSMRSFDFMFGLHMMHKIFSVTEFICQTVQKENVDILYAMQFVDDSKARLQEMREDGWPSLVAVIESFCEAHGIDKIDWSARHMDGTGRSCQQKNFISNEHYYRIDVYNAMIDVQLSELNKRFPNDASELLMLSSTLDPRDKFSQFDAVKVCTLAENFYPEDFVDGGLIDLELECPFYVRNMRMDSQFQDLASTADLCQLLAQTRKKECFPLIYRLISLVLTLPVSTATTERSFSSMNIIKNRLRNKMDDEFLDDCMVLHIEKKLAKSIKTNEVVREFEKRKNRRVKFR